MIELLNKIKQLEKKKIIAVLTAFVLAVILDVAFVMKAQINSTIAAAKKSSELKKTINDIEAKAKELALIEQKQSKEPNLAKPKSIRSANELPLLLQDISDMAKDHNVKVVQMSHAKGVKPKDKQFIPVTIKLSLNGTYHNLGAFINTLEVAEQPMYAEEITISRSPVDLQKEKVELGVKTYVK